jgi:ABC-type branched-subunit amino acid transport system ATPase component/ABC-type branched-subunit amino acid transport system permease subunit
MPENDMQDLSLPHRRSLATQGATGFSTTAWRIRLLRPLLIAGPLYAIASIIGLRLGWIPTDALISTGMVYILVLGLDLLYGCAGMLSFAHVGFFAVGAYAVAIGSVTHGLDPWISSVLGLFLNLVLSWTLGRICLRLSGSYFMLGTLAFGIMVHAVITVAHPLTGGDVGLGGVPRPTIAGIAMGTNLRFGVLVWGLALVLFAFTLLLSRSGVGRALKALRSEPAAAASLGTDIARLKTNVFVLSAMYASIAGSLFAMYHGAVHPDSFNLGVLLNVLLMLFLGGEGSLWGGLIGAMFITILPDLTGSFHAAKDLINGVLFTLIILAFPKGVAGAITKVFSRKESAGPAADDVPSVEAQGRLPLDIPPAGPEKMLRVDGIQKHFGGVHAVDGVSFSVEAGTVKGLIGPNGAGKTTLMNLISGALEPTEGRIEMEGRPLAGMRPDQVARAGLLRTFQHEKLFAHLTVEENILVGIERGSDGRMSSLIGGGFLAFTSARLDFEARERARAWLKAVGLEGYAQRDATALPTGLRKLVEVARACAANPRVLLLDETAAGLNDTERQSFRALVRRLRAEGLTIVLIEHDLELVMELCDEICVLDFGKLIADGDPRSVRTNERVIDAYIGGGSDAA